MGLHSDSGDPILGLRSQEACGKEQGLRLEGREGPGSVRRQGEDQREDRGTLGPVGNQSWEALGWDKDDMRCVLTSALGPRHTESLR